MNANLEELNLNFNYDPITDIWEHEKRYVDYKNGDIIFFNPAVFTGKDSASINLGVTIPRLIRMIKWENRFSKLFNIVGWSFSNKEIIVNPGTLIITIETTFETLHVPYAECIYYIIKDLIENKITFEIFSKKIKNMISHLHTFKHLKLFCEYDAVTDMWYYKNRKLSVKDDVIIMCLNPGKFKARYGILYTGRCIFKLLRMINWEDMFEELYNKKTTNNRYTVEPKPEYIQFYRWRLKYSITNYNLIANLVESKITLLNFHKHMELRNHD